jgi:hypothetical protein
VATAGESRRSAAALKTAAAGARKTTRSPATRSRKRSATGTRWATRRRRTQGRTGSAPHSRTRSGGQAFHQYQPSGPWASAH